MSLIYNTFFVHTDSLQGIICDMVIFLSMIHLVCYIIRFMTSLGRGGRL